MFPQEAENGVVQRVEEALRGCRELRGAALRAACDSLLNCASTHRAMKDIVHNHSFAVMVSSHQCARVFLSPVSFCIIPTKLFTADQPQEQGFA